MLCLWYKKNVHSHANKTHFGLILKVKVFGTCKRPIRPIIHIYKSSIPSPYISLKNYWKNLFKEQSIFPQVIILYILITFSLDFVLMLLGENRYWSLLGLKRELLTSVRTTRLIHQSRQFNVQRAVCSRTGSDLCRSIAQESVRSVTIGMIYNRLKKGFMQCFLSCHLALLSN